jgi:hypothetical protein
MVELEMELKVLRIGPIEGTLTFLKKEHLLILEK